MADAQIAIIDGDQTQVVLAPGENPAIVASIPGPQGPAGAVAAAIDGSAALPSIAFASDTDTGLYRVGANQLGVSTGGTQRLVIDSNGQIEATSLGTAASPTWTFVGDPNTGIYSPGADQLALSTNGTGRLFIDSSGNVGVGTAPDQRLTIASAGSTTLNIYGQGRAAAFSVGVNATGALINEQNNLPLVFNTNNQERLRITSTGQLSHIGAGSSGSPAVSFSGSAASNSLVVDSSSNVAIGNSSANNKFLLYTVGANDSYFQVANGSTGLAATQGLRIGTPAAGNANIVTDGSLTLGTGNLPRVTVTSTGLVGIGTSSPSNTAGFSQQLQLSGNLPCISIDNTGTGANKYSLGVNGVGALGIWDNTASAFRMYINSSGSVGIGNNAPNRRLEISDLNADNFIRVNTSGAFKSGIEFSNLGTAFGQLYFNNVAPYDLSLLQQYTTGSLILGTNNTERARIDSSGRLGIGTTSPGAILHTVNTSAGAATVGAFIQNSSLTAGTEVRLGFAPNSNLVSDNRYSWIAGVNDTGSNGSSLTFATTPGGQGATEKMRLDGSGRLGIGTTSPSALLTAGVAYGGTPNVQTVAVIQSATNTYVTVGAGSSSQGGILFADTAANNAGGVLYSHSTDSLEFLAGGNEAARIDSSRRLLVGTSSEPNTGGTLCVNNGIGIVNNTTNRFATVEHGNGASGTFTTITISATVQTTAASIIFETLMTGFSGVYLDNVSAQYSNQAAVTMRNSASAGTSAAMAVNGAGTTYTLTITTNVTHPVVKVKVTAGGLAGDITLPTITFA